MLDSAVRSAGDLAGVFEYDGETSYFYLYEAGGAQGHKVSGAIRVLVGDPGFDETDVSVRWDASETNVGLFICGELYAAFDGDSRAGYGGEYRSDTPMQIPWHVRSSF
jgi:hypothetical protein